MVQNFSGIIENLSEENIIFDCLEDGDIANTFELLHHIRVIITHTNKLQKRNSLDFYESLIILKVHYTLKKSFAQKQTNQKTRYIVLVYCV